MADLSPLSEQKQTLEGGYLKGHALTPPEDKTSEVGDALFPVLRNGQVVKYAALGKLLDVRILDIRTIHTRVQKFIVHQVDPEGKPMQHEDALREVGREHLFVETACANLCPKIAIVAPTTSDYPLQVSEVSAGSGASGDDAGSYVSVGTSQSECFMKEAIFKTKSGDTEFFLYAHELKKGSHVMAEDGTIVEVAAVPELREVDKIVNLHAGSAFLTVTPDHRIPMLKEITGGRCDMIAASLKPGDLIFVDGNPTRFSKTGCRSSRSLSGLMYLLQASHVQK